MRVCDLQPADRIETADRVGTCVAVHRPHPHWKHLCLVVWLLDDGTWSFDALDARQDVGQLVDVVPDAERVGAVRQLVEGRQ